MSIPPGGIFVTAIAAFLAVVLISILIFVHVRERKAAKTDGESGDTALVLPTRNIATLSPPLPADIRTPLGAEGLHTPLLLCWSMLIMLFSSLPSSAEFEKSPLAHHRTRRPRVDQSYVSSETCRPFQTGSSRSVILMWNVDHSNFVPTAIPAILITPAGTAEATASSCREPTEENVDRKAQDEDTVESAVADGLDGDSCTECGILTTLAVPKAVPLALPDFIGAVRDFFLSLSQARSTAKQLVSATGDDLPSPDSLAEDMASIDASMTHLTDSLNNLDSSVGVPNEDVVKKVFGNCSDTVDVFQKLASVLVVRFKALVNDDEIRHARSLLSQLCGSMEKLEKSWEVVAPMEDGIKAWIEHPTATVTVHSSTPLPTSDAFDSGLRDDTSSSSVSSAEPASLNTATVTAGASSLSDRPQLLSPRWRPMVLPC
jgi:hypothetical protein